MGVFGAQTCHIERNIRGTPRTIFDLVDVNDRYGCFLLDPACVTEPISVHHEVTNDHNMDVLQRGEFHRGPMVTQASPATIGVPDYVKT